MLLEQHRRERVASVLQERAMYGPMLGYFEQPAPITSWQPESTETEDEAASETDGLQEHQGGVPIETGEGPSESPLTESALNKVLDSLTARDPKSDSSSSNATKKATANQWPALRYMPSNAKHATLEEVLLRNLRFDENDVMYNVGASFPESPNELIAWEEIEEPPVDPNNPPPNGNFGLQLIAPTQSMRQRMPGWHPRMHFNEEQQKFVCQACNFATIHEREFEYHVSMEQRWISSTQ